MPSFLTSSMCVWLCKWMKSAPPTLQKWNVSAVTHRSPDSFCSAWISYQYRLLCITEWWESHHTVSSILQLMMVVPLSAHKRHPASSVKITVNASIAGMTGVNATRHSILVLLLKIYTKYSFPLCNFESSYGSLSFSALSCLTEWEGKGKLADGDDKMKLKW